MSALDILMSFHVVANQVETKQPEAVLSTIEICQFSLTNLAGMTYIQGSRTLQHCNITTVELDPNSSAQHTLK